MPNRRSKFWKKVDRALGLLVFLILAFSWNPSAAPVAFAGQSVATNRHASHVAEVLSGDTVRLRNGKMLRYAGLSAPPVESRIELLRQYAAAARLFNERLVANKDIWIEWDAQIRDDQGHLIGYVFLEDGTFVNLEILKAGHARAIIEAPNIRYQATLRQAELSARRARLASWEKEPERPFLQTQFVGDKTNKVYHFPTCLMLERVPEAYRLSFASRVDAKAAGYRNCPSCRGQDRADWESGF